MSTPTPSREHLLAATALHYARTENWPRARTAVTDLYAECGGTGLEFALRAWCDAAITSMPDTNGHPVQWAWKDTATGHIGFNSQNLPPRNRWAAQMLGARQALDIDTWEALLKALPDDRAEIASHVFALLETAALTLGQPAGTKDSR